MYNHSLHQKINQLLKSSQIDIAGADNDFYVRMLAGADAAWSLYIGIYHSNPRAAHFFYQLVKLTIKAYRDRPQVLKEQDLDKMAAGDWFLGNDITGMSLYVDRFCGNLKTLSTKLGYLENLGINLLHLMPIFESPAGESDGGYAVSNFRKVDARFGSVKDLQKLQEHLGKKKMYLMLDIVLNHTSHRHEWAVKAKEGDKDYQDFFYMFSDREIPDQYERTLPEIFPQAAPGNFTYIPECKKWVMTVFHDYQWDLNYANPAVLLAMLDNVFFYANLGVDILRIDAPAFIWKQIGTLSMNLPQVHTLLRLIKLFISVATPGMALLGEAIVEPKEIIKYFGTGAFAAKECDFAYNATQMALQWDMLATGDTRVMLSSQHELLQKPAGTSWITYTRCHDDIGLGFDDQMIRNAGFDPWEHRKFLKEYYSGKFHGSQATGALFGFNPKTGDARISGTLASLCGLEKALKENDEQAIETAVKKILLMQAHSIFLGGIPMLFYGDEAGYTNDYSYLEDVAKSYDNRWMHRPVIDWEKNKRVNEAGTVENSVFAGTRRLISIRRMLPEVADHKNLTWINCNNNHIAAYLRNNGSKQLYGVYNFSTEKVVVPVAPFKVAARNTGDFYDYWSEKSVSTGKQGHLAIDAYSFLLLKPEY